MPDSFSETTIYLAAAIVLIALGGAYYFWKKSKRGNETQYNKADSDYYGESFEMGDFDGDKELEWLRKAKKSGSNSHSVRHALKRPGQSNEESAEFNEAAFADGHNIETKAFQQKMKMLQYAQLPINSFGDLTPAKYFEPLAESNAKSLLDAIESANEENEEYESVREVAIKVLAAFRTANSVEALSQMALYDLSSGIRAKAVTVLTDFDHESVFEAILLACADPTREVRAAAARGLFRLSFDRSGAWKRIIETHDEFRMSQAVRAAVEASIVSKSFDRLIHEDIKIAYEAFTLVALIIKSGENKEIFEALRSHKDERVKFALLHVMKAVKDSRSLAGLNELRQSGKCSGDVLSKLQDAIKSLEQIGARVPA
ncbi:MAG: HEAT repeat domain-containing protein [Pyrinomonadaceae bacterium]